MQHTDLFLVTEAWRRAQAFEDDVAHAQKLDLLPKGKSWRYRTAERLLRLAAWLEPKPQRTTHPC